MQLSAEPSTEAVLVRIPDQGLLGPCGLRNRELLRARAPWVFLLDEDAEPAPDCLERLLAEARRFSQADIVSPRVMAGDSDVIHYDGGSGHFLGEACFENFHRPLARARPPSLWPGAAATTALLIRREAAIAWGLLDESLVFFREDTEFCLRARMLGARIRHCPEAIVRHRQGARGSLHARRVYFQARNRWRLMLKLFEARTLVLTLPLQAAFEVLSLARSALEGRLGQHLRAWADVLADLPALLRQRRRLQARRRVPDRELLVAAPLTWRPETVRHPAAGRAARLFGSLCSAWWRLAV